MKIVIMQPTFLPWVGYFDLIDQADIFVFLDDVQFVKQSWQQRNRIRTAKGLEWITAPVFIKGRFGQTIREVRLNHSDFPEKRIRTLRQCYARTAFFQELFEELVSVLLECSQDGMLCEMNVGMIQWLTTKLGLTKTFVRSSDLKMGGRRTELILNILKELKATAYLSPLGSWTYLKDEYRCIVEEGICVTFHNYSHPVYQQAYKPFLPGASVVDLLLNEGTESLKLIRSGRGRDLEPRELEQCNPSE